MIEAASYCMPIISSNFKSGSKEILCSRKGGSIFDIKNYLRLSQLINRFYKSPFAYYKKELVCRKNVSKFSKIKNLSIFNKILKTI